MEDESTTTRAQDAGLLGVSLVAPRPAGPGCLLLPVAQSAPAARARVTAHFPQEHSLGNAGLGRWRSFDYRHIVPSFIIRLRSQSSRVRSYRPAARSHPARSRRPEQCPRRPASRRCRTVHLPALRPTGRTILQEVDSKRFIVNILILDRAPRQLTHADTTGSFLPV